MYIHTKYMILDPLSAAGTVITCSANFSTASITANDENSIIVVGDQYVNDVYLTEFMRLFTHFAFPAAQTKQTDKTAEAHGAVPDVICRTAMRGSSGSMRTERPNLCSENTSAGPEAAR